MLNVFKNNLSLHPVTYHKQFVPFSGTDKNVCISVSGDIPSISCNKLCHYSYITYGSKLIEHSVGVHHPTLVAVYETHYKNAGRSSALGAVLSSFTLYSKIHHKYKGT